MEFDLPKSTRTDTINRCHWATRFTFHTSKPSSVRISQVHLCKSYLQDLVEPIALDVKCVMPLLGNSCVPFPISPPNFFTI